MNGQLKSSLSSTKAAITYAKPASAAPTPNAIAAIITPLLIHLG